MVMLNEHQPVGRLFTSILHVQHGKLRQAMSCFCASPRPSLGSCVFHTEIRMSDALRHLDHPKCIGLSIPILRSHSSVIYILLTLLRGGMELRKNITPPKRYRPDDIPRHSRAYVPRAMRPILPTPFVKYNPNLPPAAFPTLSEPRPPREVEQVLNKTVQDDPSDSDEDEDDDMFQGPDPGDAWRHLIEQLSFIDTESRDPDEGFIDENAVLTSVVLATRVTHALIYRYNLVRSSRHSPAASAKEADDEVGTTEEGQVSRRQGKRVSVL